jgi:hypothetical protein
VTDLNTDTVETEATTETAQETSKTYTQEEMDRHIAGMKNSLARKYERQYSELGDLDELRRLKTAEEQRQQQEAIKRGEFEKTLQELAAKKDAEIQKRDAMITEYKINSPLLDSAAKHKSVNPNQVRTLLGNRVKLNETGDEVQVLDDQGNVRYDDGGNLFTVDGLVSEFLEQNPHFKQASATTTNSKTQLGNELRAENLDLNKLDLSRPEHRKIYKEARQKGLL